MLNKKTMMLTIILACLFAVSAVSAADNATNDTVGVDEATADVEMSYGVVNTDGASDANDVSSLEMFSNEKDYLSCENNSENTLGSVIDVNEGDSFSDIIRNAQAGSIINVKEGAYDLYGSINKQLTINGNNNEFSWIECHADGIILNDIIFSQSTTSDDGGAIYSENSIEINNCTFTDNKAYVSDYSSSKYPKGGAIYSKGNLKLTNCTFKNNKADRAYDGGTGNAIYCDAKTTVFNCTFEDNCIYQSHNGRAIYSEIFEAYNSKFLRNDAVGCIEGVIVDCIFEESTGCALMGHLNISNSFFNNNTEYGPYTKGAISSWSNTVIDNCSFTNNFASVNDQAIIKNSIFMNSYLNFENANVTIDSCQFIDNTNFAIKNNDNSYLKILDSNFSNNRKAISNYGILHVSNNIMEDQDAIEIYNKYDKSGNVTGYTVSPTYVIILDNSTQSVEPKAEITLSAIVCDGNFNRMDAGDLYFIVNDEHIKGTLDGNGTYSVPFTVPTAPGTFLISAKCERATNTIIKTAKIISSKVDVKASDVIKYYGGSEKYIVSVVDGDIPLANVNVKITVNGKTSTVNTDSKGQASIPLDLPVGTYDVESEYDGVKATSKALVKSTIATSDVTGIYSNSKVTAAFLDAAGNALASKQVTFKVGDKTYAATTSSNGAAATNVDLPVGTYTVTAVNPANKEEKTFNLVINKAGSKISLTSSQINGVTTLTAALTPTTASGNVVFNVNGENRNVQINNGKAILTLKDLNPGNYMVTAIYNGDKNLNASTSNTVTFNVEEVYPILTAKDLTKTYGAANKFVVNLVDSKGNAIANAVVNVNIKGKITPITTGSNGQAAMAIGLAPGKYTAEATYASTAQATAKITIQKATPKLTAKAKTFKKSVKTKKYTVTLKTNQNKVMKNTKVTIKVNKKTYSTKTNNKGVATFKITKLTKKGKYTATVTYNGNAYYNKLTKKVKITVK